MDKKEKLTNKTNLKKKEFFKNQKKNSNEILSGFIITCDTNREKNAINDAYNLLNEVLYP